MKKRLLIIAVILLTASLIFCSVLPSCEASDEWKFERGIDLIVSFGPGSGNDQTARALAPILEKILGVRITVTNVEGGSGLIGMEHTIAQPADGYTFMMHTPTHIVFSIQGLSSVNLLTDFVPIAKIVEDVFLLQGASGKFKDWEELYAYSSTHPKELSLGGTGGVGVDFIASNLFMMATGLDMRYVSFDGGAEVMSALLGRHLDLAIGDPSTVLDLIQAGKITPYVVLANDRLAILPDVQCTKELGYDVTFGPLRAITARKGTPQGAIDAMGSAIAEAVKTEAWQNYLKISGLDVKPGYADAAGLQEVWDVLARTLPEILAKVNK